MSESNKRHKKQMSMPLSIVLTCFALSTGSLLAQHFLVDSSKLSRFSFTEYIPYAYADVPYLQSGYFGNYSQAAYVYSQAAYVYIQSSYYTQASYGGGSYTQSSYLGGGGGNSDFIDNCDNGQGGFTEVGGRVFFNGNPTNLRSGGGTSGGK